MNLLLRKHGSELRDERGDDHLLAHPKEEAEGVFDWFPRIAQDMNDRHTSADQLDPARHIDWVETDHEIMIRAELPDVDPTNVRIRVMDNLLAIHIQSRQGQEKDKTGDHSSERRHDIFCRSIQLPFSVIPDNVRAKYKDGALTVRVPKLGVFEPKRQCACNTLGTHS